MRKEKMDLKAGLDFMFVLPPENMFNDQIKTVGTVVILVDILDSCDWPAASLQRKSKIESNRQNRIRCANLLTQCYQGH